MSDLKASPGGEVTPVEKAERTLEHTRRFPDAPSAIPLYLRALLEIAVAQEKRDLASDFELTD